MLREQAQPAAEAAAPPEALYTFAWQAEHAMLRSLRQARRSSRRPAVVQWLAGAGKENTPPFPARYAIRETGRVRKRSDSDLSPAGQALRSVSWLQAAVRASALGAELRLRTRGALSFPPPQDGPGTPPALSFTSRQRFVCWHCCMINRQAT